jgi:hypothetical protein
VPGCPQWIGERTGPCEWIGENGEGGRERGRLVREKEKEEKKEKEKN